MELNADRRPHSGRRGGGIRVANRAVPEAELEEQVLRIGRTVARTPIDLQRLDHKRAVHGRCDAMGMPCRLRAGTEMQTLATFTRTAQEHFARSARADPGAQQAGC